MKMTVAMALILLSLAALGDESSERSEIRFSANDALLAYDFDTLEKLVKEYRTNLPRTSSGSLKLPYFYRGINDHLLRYAADDDVSWSESADRLLAWSAAYPDSPAPLIAYSFLLSKRGWAYRGEDAASKVSKENMERFVDYKSRAVDSLIENEAVASEDPHFYYLLAHLLGPLISDKDEYLSTISPAFDNYPNYDDLYFTVAGYLTSQWGGSGGHVENFARGAKKRTSATRGSEMYTRIYWSLGLNPEGGYRFEIPVVVWEYMIQGMDDILERYPSQWNINHFAYFSCVKRDLRSTARYVEMLHPPAIEEAWYDLENYETCAHHAKRYMEKN